VRFNKVVLIICLLLVPSFINAGEYDGGVQAKVILKAATTGNGTPIAYLKTDQPEITAMTVDIFPGAQTGWHKHFVPVYAYVITGCLTVNIEGSNSRQFNTGDVIIEVVNTRHNGVNMGSYPVKLIVFYTGAKAIPNVLKTAAP
jgi:quercetin dioxygenase-like cupin family protein